MKRNHFSLSIFIIHFSLIFSSFLPEKVNWDGRRKIGESQLEEEQVESFSSFSSSSSNFPFIKKEREKVETHELLLLSLFAFFTILLLSFFLVRFSLSSFLSIHLNKHSFSLNPLSLSLSFSFFSTSLTNCLSFRISFFTASRKESIKSCEEEEKDQLSSSPSNHQTLNQKRIRKFFKKK